MCHPSGSHRSAASLRWEPGFTCLPRPALVEGWLGRMIQPLRASLRGLCQLQAQGNGQRDAQGAKQ